MRFTLGDSCHEPPDDRRQLCARLGSIGVDAAYEIVLLVGHDPWTWRDSVIPAGGVAVVGGLHGAVVIVAAVDLGVAVVEAAAVVEVQPIDDPVLPLGLVVYRGALHVILTEAHAWHDKEAIDLVAHNRHRSHVGNRQVVKAPHRRTAEATAGSLNEIVVLGRLIVDGRDPAVSVGTERVLCGSVGVPARVWYRRCGRLDDGDVQRLTV